MPPRLGVPICQCTRSLAIRPRAIRQIAPAPNFSISTRVFAGDEANKTKEPYQLPHVSEEAAKIGEITGEGGPETQQGTPVQEMLKRDPQAQKNAPKVFKQDLKDTKPPGSRSYSTSARRLVEAQMSMAPIDDTEIVAAGYKFELPDLPLAPTGHLQHRYDPVVKQLTHILMRDGKKSVAQRNMSGILNHLRTSPPPQINPDRPLLPEAPPPSHLPLNPILYLTLAIDSVAPLLKMRSQKGAAGGGVALQIPVPLHLQQRRRKAMKWIVEAAEKRQNRGSGPNMFAQRVAEEIIAVVEGRSGVWEKRVAVHKLAVSNRANVNFRVIKGR